MTTIDATRINFGVDVGMASASSSGQLLSAVASCRELSGLTPVDQTLSRRIE
jgi:hypothetical protein